MAYIKKRPFQKYGQRELKTLSDKELLRTGCIDNVEFRLKLANFNEHKRRIQAKLAQIKEVEDKLRGKRPYNGYIKKSKTKCLNGHKITTSNSYHHAHGRFCKICAANYNQWYRKQKIQVKT